MGGGKRGERGESQRRGVIALALKGEGRTEEAVYGGVDEGREYEYWGGRKKNKRCKGKRVWRGNEGSQRKRKDTRGKGEREQRSRKSKKTFGDE